VTALSLFIPRWFGAFSSTVDTEITIARLCLIGYIYGYILQIDDRYIYLN
jgi:hypothetical protein